MKCNELKAKLASKDAEVKEKREYSLKLFNLIKDDCLNIVMNKTIENNLEAGASLRGFEIIDVILKKIELNISTSYFRVFDSHGVESAWVGIDPHMSMYNRSNSDVGLAEALIEKMDYSRICIMLRNFIVSKGFKAKQYTHRFTGDTINSLDFTITRRKLELILSQDEVKPNQEIEELNENLIGGVIITLICIIAFIYFVLA